MREREAVQALADLADVLAGLIEFEQARVLAAGVNEDVALGVGGDADAFAQVQIGWKLQEVRHRIVGDLGHVLRFRLGLREGGRDGEQKRNKATFLHGKPLAAPESGAT